MKNDVALKKYPPQRNSKNLYLLLVSCYPIDMLIRKAEIKDIDDILYLLSDVLELHAKIRPDIFESGHTKYTKEELIAKLSEDNFRVYVGEISNKVVAYAMCVIETPKFVHTMKPIKTMYIDDIEVKV